MSSEIAGPRCDPSEAPNGFYAVPKSSVNAAQVGNFCNACDWRAQCNDPATDLLAYGHRCMSYAVIALRDGKTYQRKDECSVVFKKSESPRVKGGQKNLFDDEASQ